MQMLLLILLLLVKIKPQLCFCRSYIKIRSVCIFSNMPLQHTQLKRPIGKHAKASDFNIDSTET